MILRPLNQTGHKRRVQKLTKLKPNADSYDWRDHGAVTPVKNQGQCGSCWAFSTVGAVEGCVAIESGTLLQLSEQELVSCDKKCSGCGGGLMDLGFEWIAENGGISSEEYYPYTAKNDACSIARESYKVSITKAHQDVEKNNDDQFIAALQRGPVSVAIEADQDAFQFYKKGVFNGTCGTSLDHGVLAVGYAADYYTVKNSWGESWGEQGYIRMARNMPQEGGQCGILLDASFPTQCEYLNPGPVPPTPTTPEPIGTPYQDPAKGPCMTGEKSFTAANVKGSFCTQACDSSSLCPSAPDDMVVVLAGCAIYDSTADLVCGVFCDTSNANACNPKENMTCKAYNVIVGLCTYDDSEEH